MHKRSAFALVVGGKVREGWEVGAQCILGNPSILGNLVSDHLGGTHWGGGCQKDPNGLDVNKWASLDGLNQDGGEFGGSACRPWLVTWRPEISSNACFFLFIEVKFTYHKPST